MKPLLSLSLLAMLTFTSTLIAEETQKNPAVPAPPPAAAPGSPNTAWPFDAAEAAKRQTDTAKSLNVPKDTTLTIGNTAMKLVLIPAGKFTMGLPKDEKSHSLNASPDHDVTITKPFYMGVYPVTQQQYDQLIGKDASQFKGADNPVEMMSWDDAADFCKALSKKTGKTVRLPTEAEWEYGCRAGAGTLYYFGDDPAKLGDYAWFATNGANTTHPVGRKKPNAWGLYDMNGNVWQWCADWVGADYYASSPKEDPPGPATGTFRVLRGGSWPSDAAFCASAFRSQNVPAHRVGKIGSFGFRAVVELEKK